MNIYIAEKDKAHVVVVGQIFSCHGMCKFICIYVVCICICICKCISKKKIEYIENPQRIAVDLDYFEYMAEKHRAHVVKSTETRAVAETKLFTRRR